MKTIKLMSVALVAMALSACDGAGSPTAEQQNGYLSCSEPRPEVCTQEYMPVCGRFSDGSTATYSNACSACADTNIEAYQSGACE